jgi:hypothetical protein
MTAYLILTTDQATAIEAANAGTNKTLAPRQLDDGRLILNIDVLSDPDFADPTGPWSPILTQAQQTLLDQNFGPIE